MVLHSTFYLFLNFFLLVFSYASTLTTFSTTMHQHQQAMQLLCRIMTEPLEKQHITLQTIMNPNSRIPDGQRANVLYIHKVPQKPVPYLQKRKAAYRQSVRYSGVIIYPTSPHLVKSRWYTSIGIGSLIQGLYLSVPARPQVFFKDKIIILQREE